MLDPEIRKAFIEQYLRKQGSKSLIYEEVGILTGTSIVDIALFNPEFFQAFEIKSGADSTQRLPNQIENYAKIFDSISIITEKSQVLKMLRLIPDYWGVIIVDKVFGEISFDIWRMPKHNQLVNKRAMAELLWRDEAAKALRKKGIKGTSKKKRKALWNKIETTFTLEELRKVVVETMNARGEWKNLIKETEENE